MNVSEDGEIRDREQTREPREDDAAGLHRAFVAVRMPEEVQEALARVQRTLRRWAGDRVRWTDPSDLHLTLAFFGSLTPEWIVSIAGAAEIAAATSPVFSFEVVGLGGFGNRRGIRVLWAGVPSPPPALVTLAARLEKEVRERGWPMEERPFRPHITLGRARDPIAMPSLTEACPSLINAPFGEVRAERVSLMAAAPDRRTPRYVVVRELPLRG